MRARALILLSRLLLVGSVAWVAGPIVLGETDPRNRPAAPPAGR